MSTSTFSSRDFNQDTGKAKKNALNGPVYITDRGKPSYVLLSIKDYQTLSVGNKSIGDLLSMDGVEDIEFIPHVISDLAKPIEF